MSEITFTLQINVGVTPQLGSLLERLLAPSADAVEANRVWMEASAKSIEANNAVIAQIQSDAQPAKAEEAKAEKPAKAEEAKAEKPAKAEDAKAAEPKYDATYVRAAIDRTRRRIEGENYKQETAGERYKKYHTQLTGEFKRIAQTLSADTGNPTEKPTELPEDLRRKFSDQCDELYLDAEGRIQTKIPF